MRNYSSPDINHAFFATWSPAMAWALGLWITDGTVRTGDNLISIGFADATLLAKLQTVMGSNHRVYHDVRDSGYHLVQITSTPLKAALKQLGVVEAKTLVVECPAVPSDYWWHFMRGVFEGDGHCYIGFKKPVSKGKRPEDRLVQRPQYDRPVVGHHFLELKITSGSRPFLEAIHARNAAEGITGGSIQSIMGRRNVTHRLTYATMPAVQLFHRMYDGVPDAILSAAKRDKFYGFSRLQAGQFPAGSTPSDSA